MKNNIQEQDFDKKYPSKDFTKSYWTFTPEELRKLAQLDTIVQMGQIAQVMVNTLIQGECLQRVQPKNSPDIGILYDVPNGKFVTYVPKIWCTSCGVRRATFEFGGKFYCQTCVAAQKAVPAGPVQEVPKKKKAK